MMFRQTEADLGREGKPAEGGRLGKPQIILAGRETGAKGTFKMAAKCGDVVYKAGQVRKGEFQLVFNNFNIFIDVVRVEFFL